MRVAGRPQWRRDSASAATAASTAPPAPPSPPPLVRPRPRPRRSLAAAAVAADDLGSINKQVIAGTMSPALYAYLLAHTREPPLLRQLRDETAEQHGAHMQVRPARAGAARRRLQNAAAPTVRVARSHDGDGHDAPLAAAGGAQPTAASPTMVVLLLSSSAAAAAAAASAA